jgi:hypothetical protein
MPLGMGCIAQNECTAAHLRVSASPRDSIFSKPPISAGHGLHRSNPAVPPKDQPQRAQRAQRNYSAFGARSAQSPFLCAPCVLCGERFLRWAWAPSSHSKPEPIGTHRVHLAARASSPLGMGSVVHSLISAPADLRLVTSSYPPVLFPCSKHEHFACKPEQSLYSVPSLPARVGWTKEGRAPCRRLICVSSIGI